MTARGLDSPFTGLFVELGPTAARAHDPDVHVRAGRLVPGLGAGEVGGAGLNPLAADRAVLGEAVERAGATRLPGDQVRRARFIDLAGEVSAVAPDRFVLFLPDQYAQPGFPFRPFTRETECGWLAFRDLADGRAVWVPEPFAYLACEGDDTVAPRISTGLAAGSAGDPVVLRGLQEVIERDASAAGWWGAYPLEEHDAEGVWAALGPSLAARFRRPNLTWRFYRVDTPLAAHATWVTCRGEDREGDCFSTGSAVRETRAPSWTKSLLEAVQGRHWVRHLLAQGEHAPGQLPGSFAAHAVYYSLNGGRLAGTPLERARRIAANADPHASAVDDLSALRARLGGDRPVLVRAMTPPFLAGWPDGWRSVRVVVPGLQPLAGHHALAHLGGPRWARPLSAWSDVPPHPFA